MGDLEPIDDLDTLHSIIAALKKVEPTERKRLLQTVVTFFDLDVPPSHTRDEAIAQSSQIYPENRHPGAFSEDRSMSPKAFLAEKHPETDVERVACLGYYLTHYRNTPHFKTLDISKINTEAAEPKFTNAAWSVANAEKRGYLVHAPQGHKQLSATGERFVLALPDRDNAKEVLRTFRVRKASKKSSPSINEGTA
jgi:hypothetical protein